MHEMNLASELIRVIKEYAADKVVRRVRVDIGVFSGANEEAFRFACETFFPTELNSGIEIVLNSVEGEMECTCGAIFHTNDPLSACTECNGYNRTVKKGTDVTVTSIEVED